MSTTWSASGTEPLIERLRRAVLGRYDVYAELGAGGMASVFLALDLALDRKVAIKVMAPALAGSPDNVERFKREAKVAAALNHPNIIGILAVGDDPELAYFVMKFVEGRSLDSVIREDGPQAVPFVQSVIGSAGRALHYAHSRGVIHRDVKPANFMLDQDGWIVVTDFGIAKQGDAKGLTVTGSLIGTPYYMAPELFHGKAVTHAADQYALGIVAYELLTGTQPYTGETVAEVMRGHLFDAVPNVRTVRPDVPAEVETCIARMMAKEPAERFATLEEAVQAFGAISATQEHQVRTQIIELAKVGALQQPQVRVPVSPVPVTRGPARPVPSGPLDATTPLPRARTAERPVPSTRQRPAPEAPAPARRRSRWPVAVGGLFLVAGMVGVVALVRPEWLGLAVRGPSSAGATAAGPQGDASRRAATPAASPASLPASSASSALRDSLERAQRLAAALRDSLQRADSVARADSIARVAAVARADSITRVDSTRLQRLRALQARRNAQVQPGGTAPTRPGARPAGPLRRPLKDGTRGTVPPRNP